MTVKKPLFYKGFGRCDFRKFEKNEENQGNEVKMIEILEKGTRKQCTCENCGAELSYEKNDIKDKPKRTIDFRTLKPVYPSNYIICPQCKHPVEVEVDEND